MYIFGPGCRGGEVSEDAGAVGEPACLALDPGEDGSDGVDTVARGVIAGDGFALGGPESGLVWHGFRVEGSRSDLQGEMACVAGHFVFAFLGLGYVMILECAFGGAVASLTPHRQAVATHLDIRLGLMRIEKPTR